KSGGMISGALRATSNSSGAARRPPSAAQALVATAATMTRELMALRMFDSLLGGVALRPFLRGQESAHQQNHHGDSNRGIADIEYQERAELAEMKVGEVADVAEAGAVEDVAERSAQHH